LCCNDMVDIWCFKLCCIQCSWHYDFSLDSFGGIVNIPSLIKQLFLISQVGHGFHPWSLPILLHITPKNEKLINKNYKFQTCNNILINMELRQTWFILHNLPWFWIQLWHMVGKSRNNFLIVFMPERRSIPSC
jgi:hypothetical protein